MFFVDKPYISDFLRRTIRDNKIPVVGTEIAGKMGLLDGTIILGEKAAVEAARKCRAEDLRIYTTSENAIGWIAENLSFTGLPEKIALFKDKAKFRELIRPLFPDFYFQKVSLGDLKKIKIDDIPLPFVIKPAVGFFSMGVHKVTDKNDWLKTVSAICADADRHKSSYPKAVLDTGFFIIEQCIDGDEYAFDAYYDSDGAPVVLSVFNHTFSSDTDVSDRIYTTSGKIIEENIGDFTDFAGKIGELAHLRNFPVHVEVRRNGNVLMPIEINPMRFGGWCTTADMTFLAYGFNPYLCYYLQQKPDWNKVLKGKGEELFSLIVLDNSTGVDINAIKSFDYEKLLLGFEKPLELRKIDYREHSVFGFLFVETGKNNFIELKRILNSNLAEFISTDRP